MKCAICGRTFLPHPQAHRQKYCSKRCAQTAANRLKHAKTAVADKPIRKSTLPPREDFQPIPQAPHYEMNSQGILRNSKTGKILKWQVRNGNPDSKQVVLRTAAQKKVVISFPDMLWRLFGEIVSKTRPVPVVINKGTRSLHFDTCTQAARHLAEVTGKAFSTCQHHLAQRKTQIYDWHIHYCY